MADAVVHRLEEVTAKLERIAAKLGGGHAHEEKGVHPAVAAYDDLIQSTYKPFFATCERLDGLKPIGHQASAALTRVRDVIDASFQCKKPADKDMMKFLEPIAKAVGDAQHCDNRSAFFNHQKAFSEAIQLVNWVLLPGPVGHVRATLEAADFYLQKILVIAKDAADPDKEIHRAFVSQLKAVINDTADYLQNNFKQGLIWNAKGGDINQYHPGGHVGPASHAPAPGGAAPPPPPPVDANFKLSVSTPSESKPAVGGLEAVFSQIKIGEGITSGLKKVTSDMKSKNLKDKPTLEPKAPAPTHVAPSRKPAEVHKDPVLELRQGTWFCEYYNADVEIKDIDKKQNIYILKARNCTISIPEKCKSIQIDGCAKARIIFSQVISSLEIVNSDRVTVVVTENCPTIAVDKSNGVQIILNETSVQNPPSIITSNTNELNLVVPGKTPEDDPIEHALPHQFLTLYKDGKIVTEPVSHSGA